MTAMAAGASAYSSGTKAFLDDAVEDEVLAPEVAFKVDLVAQDSQTLRADFLIAPGHYLYKNRFKFELLSEGAVIAGVELPEGVAKEDPTFGLTEVYYDYATALIYLSEGSRFPMEIQLTYQGCSAKGLCYAPLRKTFTVNADGTAAASGLGAAGQAPSKAAAVTNDNEKIATLLKDGKLWLIVAGFFGFGLLLSFTPCVLPMIPILSSIIVGGKKFSRWHTFNLSLAYTLGMALTYTLMGIAAGLSGQMLSAALQNAWALGFGALIFVLLALSMFGFYELQLPSVFESRIANLTNRIKGGHFFGVFLMGALSALILSPCVAAPLAAALLYISQTHDVLLGGVALFALSMGMGVPLLLLGASAGDLLPKAGAWMNAVRNFFGVVMLAMAVWLVSPLLPVAVQLLLWAALLIVPAIYMHAVDALPVNAHKWLKFWKGIAIIMLVLGIALLIGAMSGAKSALQPLSGLRAGPAAEQASRLPFQRVKTVAELESRIQAAAGKRVMLDFYADWCVACKEMELFTFSDSRVQAELKDVVLLQADVTQNSTDDAALLKRFELFGPPGIIFFDKNGQEVAAMRVIGFQDADKFLQTLSQAKS
ncbi:MAG: thiol:disulfide interchange protein [Betaproteobacteria bacterium HGW-Betaproteobacteria-8]|nr:MAG: thiol:disulfide interchange protein [Betaproteobacteria bacterium HGW-Betaproteobacteria-8]